jgi:hypothetical protein
MGTPVPVAMLSPRSAPAPASAPTLRGAPAPAMSSSSYPAEPTAVLSRYPSNPAPSAPWTGLAVLAIWVAIALAAAAILLRRRDAWLTPLPNGRFTSVELARALPDEGTEDADAQVLGQAHGGRRHRAEWLSATI